MGDLIQDDSESQGDGDYFDPNAGQENNFGATNVKPWDGRGGKMPTFARGTPVGIIIHGLKGYYLSFSNLTCRDNMGEELTDGELKLIFGIKSEIEINHFYHLGQMKNG